jgi:gliding motility-associated-like protein
MDFSLGQVLPDTNVVLLSIGGTSTPGVDHTPLFPDSLVFLPGQTQQSVTFNCPLDDDGPETLTVTVQTRSSCSGALVSTEFVFQIVPSAPVVATSGTATIPCLDTAVFSPSISGGFPPYEVLWSNGTEGAEIVVSPLLGTTFEATVTDACGTVTTSEFVVEVEDAAPVPVIPTLSPGIGVVGPTTIQESCYPVTMVFTLAQSLPDTNVVEVSIGGTSTPGVDHSPLFPDSLVFLPGQTQLSVTFNCPVDDDGPETLAVTLIIRSVCSGEPVSTEFLFQIVPSAPVEATSGSATIPCEGTAVFTPVISGGFAPYEVRWSDGSTGANLTVSPLTNTTYTATVTDTCGSTTTAAFVVDLEPIQPVQFTIDGPSSLLEACEQTTLVVTRAPGVQGDLTISFGGSGEATPGADYVLPGPVVLPDGTQSIELPFAPLEDGVDDDQEEATITATVTDACGRSADSFVDLTILDAPDILVLGQDTTVVCANDSILSIVVATGGVGTLDISWSNGYTGTSAWLSTEIDADYVVTVTDDCARTAQTTISVDLVCDVVIPNVISPNGDQYNEALVIEGLQYLSHTLRIFNRWGQLVFESSDYLRRWKADGHPDGTYFYELVVEDREKPYTGHITVLR